MSAKVDELKRQLAAAEAEDKQLLTVDLIALVKNKFNNKAFVRVVNDSYTEYIHFTAQGEGAPFYGYLPFKTRLITLEKCDRKHKWVSAGFKRYEAYEQISVREQSTLDDWDRRYNSSNQIQIEKFEEMWETCRVVGNKVIEQLTEQFKQPLIGEDPRRLDLTL